LIPRPIVIGLDRVVQDFGGIGTTKHPIHGQDQRKDRNSDRGPLFDIRLSLRARHCVRQDSQNPHSLVSLQ
jgi:hypothetical protein